MPGDAESGDNGQRQAAGGDHETPLGNIGQFTGAQLDAAQQHQEKDSEIGKCRETLVFRQARQCRTQAWEGRHGHAQGDAGDEFADERRLMEAERDLAECPRQSQKNKEDKKEFHARECFIYGRRRPSVHGARRSIFQSRSSVRE